MNYILTTSLVVGGLIAGALLQTNKTTNNTTVQIPAENVVTELKKDNLVSLKNIKKLDLDSKNTVMVEGQIASNAAEIATEITEKSAPGKPIYLYINSPGGSLLDGAMIISALEAAPGPVYTVCGQLCASMAAVIFSYGKERYMVDRSILMYHPASGSSKGTLEEMQSLLSTITRYFNKMNVHIAARAGISLETFQNMFVSQLWLDAQDCVEKKFADAIVSVNLKVDTKLIRILGSDQDKDSSIKEKFNIKW